MVFRPGQSGNPAGRKPGPSKTARLRTALEKHVPDILEALLASAKDGDVPSAKLILERCLPALKPENRPLPPKTPSDPREIIGAVAGGALTLEQAAGLLDLSGRVAALGSLAEMEARLGALEALLKQSND
jgi:hypothetical protein